MRKTRRLMDKNNAHFQMLIILLSFIAIGSNSQISEVHVTLYSSNVKRIKTQISGACAGAKI